MKKICIFLLIIFLVGCNENIETSDAVLVNVQNTYKEKQLYNLYINKKYVLNKYEPEQKSYTGVFIEQKEGDFINQFKDFTNTDPSVYMQYLKLTDSYPLSWVLNCYSNLKTPFITILPPDNEEDFFNKTLIKNLAKDFGNLKIPMFVNVYPANETFLKNQSEYIKFLQDAKTYFNIYAPNVAMVWSVDLDFCYDAQSLYPGDNYVDWVGLNVYENIDENKKLNLMFKQFDFLYKNYAYKKPMFINLAISHFGSPSYEYNINDKINELDRFFNKMPNKYKRLKMINYINYDTFKANTKNKQNYLVTDNKKILESYTKLLNSDMFLDTVNFSNTNKEVLDQHKTDSIVYKIDDTFFVDENFLLNNNIESINENISQNIINIDGKNYYDFKNVLNLMGKQAEIDETNQKIVIQ